MTTMRNSLLGDRHACRSPCAVTYLGCRCNARRGERRHATKITLASQMHKGVHWRPYISSSITSACGAAAALFVRVDAPGVAALVVLHIDLGVRTRLSKGGGFFKGVAGHQLGCVVSPMR